MNKQPFWARIGGSSLAMAFVAASISSASAQEYWKRGEFVYEPIDHFISELDEDRRVGEFIYPVDSSQPGIMLTCAGGQLDVWLALTPFDFSGQKTLGEDRRPRPSSARLTIGDTQHGSDRWILYPAEKLVFSDRRQDAARVYNAVVRGDHMVIEVTRGGYSATIVPPPYDHTFADFGGECGIGTKARGDEATP